MMNLWHCQVYCLGAQACHLCDEAAFEQAWNKGHNTNPKISLFFLDEIPRPTRNCVVTLRVKSSNKHNNTVATVEIEY